MAVVAPTSAVLFAKHALRGSGAEPAAGAARLALHLAAAGVKVALAGADQGGCLAGSGAVTCAAGAAEARAQGGAGAVAFTAGDVEAEREARAAGFAIDAAPYLAVQPQRHGLEPFAAAEALAQPWRLSGKVVAGVGRGSSTLGIPTANLEEGALEAAGVDDAATGIYVALATVGGVGPVYDAVMSVGFNPHFPGQQKRTAEPWLLHEFGEGADFRGEELRLLVLAYVRPEAAFTGLDALVARIHADADVARAALPALRAALPPDALAWLAPAGDA